MDDVRVVAVIVGKAELVGVAVLWMRPVDPQRGDEAVLPVGLPDGLSHEAAVSGAGGEDDAVAGAHHVGHDPGLLGKGIGAEDHL